MDVHRIALTLIERVTRFEYEDPVSDGEKRGFLLFAVKGWPHIWDRSQVKRTYRLFYCQAFNCMGINHSCSYIAVCQ